MPLLSRLVIIADTGGEQNRHIGDEAMLEANLAAIRKALPHVTCTVVSRDPTCASRQFAVDSVAPPAFSRGQDARALRRSQFRELLSSAAAGSCAEPLTAAVKHCDGVILSGGGNLCSTWPDLLYERVALIELARLFGKPVAVLGQTIGPHLTREERHMVARALSFAKFVGVRELDSLELALESGVPRDRLWYQGDDALFGPDDSPLRERAAERPPTIAVTIDPQLRAAGTPLFDSLASQLRELSVRTNARLLLLPHAFGDEAEDSPSDIREARLLAASIGADVTVVDSRPAPGKIRQLTAAADLVVSTRYHPIIFALGAAVPALGIYNDEYCRIKLHGALAHAGMERWALTFDAIASGRFLAASTALWDSRTEVSSALARCCEKWRHERDRRWTAVFAALAMPQQTARRDSTLFGGNAEEVVAAIAAARGRRVEGQRRERALDRRRRLYRIQAKLGRIPRLAFRITRKLAGRAGGPSRR